MADTEQATNAADQQGSLCFVDYHEVRDPAHAKDHKNRSVQFFLHDNQGREVLAVIGDDIGTIEVRTRKDVISWLEMIIHESQLAARGGIQEEVEHLGEQTPSNPDGLYYVRHEQKRDHLSDGRRVNRWFLVDQNEELHLAVQGEERDARDGHYIYSSQDPFASLKPMGTCTNQQQVLHWLENFITHHAKAGMHVGDHIRSGPGPGSNSRGRSPHKRRSPRPPAKSPDTSGNPERRSKRARHPSDRAGEPASKRIASPQTTYPSPISNSTPAPALAAATKAVAGKTSGKAPSKTPATAQSSEADPSAPGADVGSPGAATAATVSEKNQTAKSKLGGAAEASQARRVKAVQAAAKAQVAALHRAVQVDVCKQLEIAQKAHEAKKAAALHWCLHPTPQGTKNVVFETQAQIQGDVEHAEAYLPVILAALRKEGIAVPAAAAKAIDALGPAADAPHPAADCVELLEALREVAKVYAAADLLTSRQIVELVSACEKHSRPAVRAMARDAINGWRRLALAHVRFLADPVSAVDPLAMFKEAMAQGTLKVPLPEHLKLALEGTLPPAKQKTASTLLESVHNLPKQHEFRSSAPPTNGASAPESKEARPRKSISFGGDEQPGTAVTPMPAAGGPSAGFDTVQGPPRTDNTMNRTTPCMPNLSPGDRMEQVTPQLLTAPETAKQTVNTQKEALEGQPKQPDEDHAAPDNQVKDAAAAAAVNAEGEGGAEKPNGATQGAPEGDEGAGLPNGTHSEKPDDAAAAAADAPGEDTAARDTRNTDGKEEQALKDMELKPGEGDAAADSSAKATIDIADPASKSKESVPGVGESVTNVAAEEQGNKEAVVVGSVADKLPADGATEGAEQSTQPAAAAAAGDAEEAAGGKEGDQETNGGSGYGSGASASKVASATSRVESQEWGTEDDVAEALRSMPVPTQLSAACLYEYVQHIRSMLYSVPPAALQDLCRRVVEATQGLLQQAAPAESQAIPANEQMHASAVEMREQRGRMQMLMNIASNLLANMAPSERLEVIKMLESQLQDLESCLQFHHQSTAAP